MSTLSSVAGVLLVALTFRTAVGTAGTAPESAVGALTAALHMVASASHVEGCDLFVAAGSPLVAARDAVRAALRTRPDAAVNSDLVVCLDGGVYDGGISFDASDSPSPGRGKVIWRGSRSAANPTIVSGGVQITGWKAASLAGKSTFAAPLPAGVATLKAVRQLWVSGQRANRTTIQLGLCADCKLNMSSRCAFSYGDRAASSDVCPTPAEPFCIGYEDNVSWGKCGAPGGTGVRSLFTSWGANASGAVGFTTASPLPTAWRGNGKTANAIEFVWPIVIRNWIEPRCTLRSIVGNNITLAHACGNFLRSRHGALPPPPLRIEGAPPTAPLASGEFYHDVVAGVLYYTPRPGVGAQSAAELDAAAWVAAEEVLLSVNGTARHTWEGITFRYATWGQANSDDGYVASQATVHACTSGGSCEPLGAVRVSDARDVTFARCTFEHIGECSLCTVTFYANLAHSLTRSP